MERPDLKWWVDGLGRYTQLDSRWASQDYGWDDKEFPGAPTYGKIGCTMTAFTNVLHWATNGVNSPTPSDTNKNNDKLWDAFMKIYFKCLVTGKQLRYENEGDRSYILDGSLSPIPSKGDKYRKVLNDAKWAISRKNPVLLSYSSCRQGDDGWLHSVVVGGVDKSNEIWVHDPYENVQHTDLRRLSNNGNITPCGTLYKAYECIRR
jgi:hypothetical protein